VAAVEYVMAFLVLMFLDLVAPTTQKGGDEALYRQAMADHHLSGAYDLAAGSIECAQVAANGSDLTALHAAFIAVNHEDEAPRKVTTHFSRIGWDGNRAWVQLRTSDAVSCLLYRRSAPASFRLVREVRLPH
jgi:hypothetical protein